LIEYYRQKDVELLEKILLNLNLSKYRNILEVRHICESEFLTSALIHILTNLFDNDNEVRIIGNNKDLEHGLSLASLLPV
jgi:transcriptional regulator of met regulon